MDAAVRAALAEVIAPVSGAPTLPPAVYVDPAVHAFEIEHLFRRGWVGIGRTDRWTHVGDYAALTVGGVPIVVVRNDAGLVGFANTCRHRGAEVAHGEGSCRKLRCPFHGWTYALDGRLVGAPEMAQADGFDKAAFPLPSVSVAVHAGFAFVSLESDPPPLAQWLGDFDSFHRSWPLAGLLTGRRREFEVDCNWKTFCEVFNEYYHLPYVHPDSIDATYLDPDDGDKTNGNFATQFGETTTTGALLEGDKGDALPDMPGLGGRDARGARYTWLYPNMTFAVGNDSVWMYETHPISPDRTRVVQTVCFPPETFATDAFGPTAQRYYDRMDVAIGEDIPVLESQQRGLASPFAKPGRFSRLEPSVGAFAIWYAERMLAATG